MRTVREEEEVLPRWARCSTLVGVAALILASLALMISELVAPAPNPSLDGSPLDPAITAITVDGDPYQWISRPGILGGTEPDRVRLGTHLVGTLARPLDWTQELVRPNRAHTPVEVDLSARFNRAPGRWAWVTAGRVRMLTGNPSGDPVSAHAHVVVAPGSAITVQPLGDDVVRLGVPANQILWGYAVATPSSVKAPSAPVTDAATALAGHDASPVRSSAPPAVSSPTSFVEQAVPAAPPPEVVVRVGAVAPETIRAKVGALNEQDTWRLITASFGALGLGSLAWALFCLFGLRDAWRD